MFYKNNIETGEWYIANEIHFPDGIKLNKDNKSEKDGWFWLDEAPQEYLDYLEERNTMI